MSIGSGGYIHKSNKSKLDNFYKVIVPKLKKDFTDKIKIEELIEYELINHECYYIGDYSLVVFSIKDFYKDMPNEEIIKKVQEVYNATKDRALRSLDNNSIGI